VVSFHLLTGIYSSRLALTAVFHSGAVWVSLFQVCDNDADVEEALWEKSHGFFPPYRVPWDYRHSAGRPPPDADDDDCLPRMLFPPDADEDPLDFDSLASTMP